MNLNLILGIVFLVIGMLSLVKIGKAGNVPGGRSVGMGGVSVCHKDFWSLYQNQAGLTGVEVPSWGACAGNRFLMIETVSMSVGFVLPFKKSVFGISYEQFGYRSYRTFFFGLAYARSFGEKFSAGIRLNYLGASFAGGYGRSAYITFEAGIQVVLTDDLTFGLHVFNPLGTRYDGFDQTHVLSIINAGLEYRIHERISICLEMEKDAQFKPRVRTGIEFELYEKGHARLGYSNVPALSRDLNFSLVSVYTFGFGFQTGNFHVDMGAFINSYLGVSPTFSINYSLTKTGNE